MQKQDFEYFLGKPLRLILKPHDFSLYGKILRVSDDCIVFQTKQKTSIIPFQNISSLMECQIR